MKHRIKYYSLVSLLCLAPLSSLQAKPHSHAGRTHSHPLPTEGIGHKHGGGASGIAVGDQPIPPVITTNQPARANPSNTRAIVSGNANNELQRAYKQKNYSKVYQIASAYAKRGDPAGQYVLGQLFLHGQGQKKNPKTAFNWFKKSADKGHPGSQYLLGSLYATGTGTGKNLQIAHKY